MIRIILLFLSPFLFQACEDEGDDHGGGIVLVNHSIIRSSNLSLTQATESCTSSTCTPTNLEGRVFAAGAMLWSSGGGGGGGYNMTFLADNEDVINDPSEPGHPPGTLTFDLGQPSVFSGLISIPEEEQVPSSAVISRIETYFDYIDATVSLSGSSIDDNYVIRTVFRKTATENDTTGTMELGDKLIRKSSEESFRWCDANSCSETRMTSPLQDSNLLAIDADNDNQEGNPNYALYSIDLKSELSVSNYDLISNPTRLWTIDYDLEDSVHLNISDTSDIESESDLLEAFSLQFSCSGSGCEPSDDRITATLTIGEPDSAGN